MKFIKLSSLTAILIFLLVLTAKTVSAQNNANDVLVTGEITGAGNVGWNNIPGLFIKLVVVNNSSEEKEFTIMSCSWQENWQTDKRHLAISYPGCDKNVDEIIKLKSGQAIVFYGFLTSRKDNKESPHLTEFSNPVPPYDKWKFPPSEGLTVRFGFSERIPNNPFEKVKSKIAPKVWWSKPVSLQFEPNSYFVTE